MNLDWHESHVQISMPRCQFLWTELLVLCLLTLNPVRLVSLNVRMRLRNTNRESRGFQCQRTQKLVLTFCTHAYFSCTKYVHLCHFKFDIIHAFVSYKLMKFVKTSGKCNWPLWLDMCLAAGLNLCISFTWPSTLCVTHMLHTDKTSGMHRDVCVCDIKSASRTIHPYTHIPNILWSYP